MLVNSSKACDFLHRDVRMYFITIKFKEWFELNSTGSAVVLIIRSIYILTFFKVTD